MNDWFTRIVLSCMDRQPLITFMGLVLLSGLIFCPIILGAFYLASRIIVDGS